MRRRWLFRNRQKYGLCKSDSEKRMKTHKENLMKKLQKSLSLLLALILFVSMLAACATPEPAVEEPAAEQPVVEEPAAEEPAAEGAPYTIGISNPFITSEYRTQMIDDLETTNEEYMAMGLTTELVIESENTDIAGQLQQIENLMNQGVDALLVNPGDAVALNQILEEAVEAGIIVISIDQEIEAVGLIEGFIGHPANEYRMSGVDEVFEDYPGINVLASETGSWDEATGQQVMADFLAAYPDLDGYWTQDGMAIGAMEAVKAAGLDEYPLGVGEGRVKFLKLWKEALDADPEFKSFAVANAPGVAATGLPSPGNSAQP